MFEYQRLSCLVRRPLPAFGLLTALFLLAQVPSATGAEAAEAAAEGILETAGFRGGLIVHVGCGDGALAAVLGTNDQCLVLGLTRDAAQAEAARRRIADAGLGGR